MNYRKTAYCVYDLKYHIVSITKYCKPILHGAIGKQVRELIRHICVSLYVYIVKRHISKGPVHLLVSIPPKLSVSEMVNRLKGGSSQKMLEEDGELRQAFRGKTMWVRGYFAVSTGNAADEIIVEYIENQKLKAPDEQD